MLVLESVRFIVLTPFWQDCFLVEKQTLFQKFIIILSICKSLFTHIFDVLFDIGAFILPEVGAIEHFSCCFFCLLAMDNCKFVHLFQMFSQDLSFKWSHSSQETSRVASPDLSFFDLRSINYNSSSCNESSRMHSSMSDCSSHSHVRVV